MTLFWLGIDEGNSFPPIQQALSDPNGLLAAGGDLSPARLLAAYRIGVFPWFSEGQPILWWCPDPRTVLRPEGFHLSRSLRRSIRRHEWHITINQAFDAVVRGCAEPRQSESETWITREMQVAYSRMHELGWAHSLEVWRDDLLVGGIYGVAIDRLFCGESMFMRVTDASKVALFSLCRILRSADFRLLDCQMHTPHLASLGAVEISRSDYAKSLLDNVRDLKPWNPAPIPDTAERLL
ncbi:MAG: leucyl/phenylalanyl-tRNA--protein transferase [Pseudomonadota bacterium]